MSNRPRLWSFLFIGTLIVLWAGDVQRCSGVLYLFAKWARVDVTLLLPLLRRVLLAFSRTVLTGFPVYSIPEDSATRSFIYAPILLRLREEANCIRGSQVLQAKSRPQASRVYPTPPTHSQLITQNLCLLLFEGWSPARLANNCIPRAIAGTVM